MGAARVLQSLGEGLYRVHVLFHTERIEAESARLAQLQANIQAAIATHTAHLSDLQHSMDDARIALDAVIAQYRDELITMAQPHVPADPPGAAGGTSEEVAANLEAELLALINAERADALTRAPALDDAAHQWAGYCLANNTTRDPLRDLTNYVVTRGYSYDAAVGIERAQAFGASSAAQALAMMQRAGEELTQADYTECGIAFRSIPASAYGYAWVVILTAPGDSVDITYPPAEDTAQPDAAIPEQFDAPAALVAAAQCFAQAASAYHATAAVLADLAAQQAAVQTEIDAVHTTLAMTQENIVEMWCVQRFAEIPPETLCRTAEIAGYYNTMQMNLLPELAFEHEAITPAMALSDAGAVYNLALEPGWLRWQPMYRYATLSENSSAILHPLTARGPERVGLPADPPDMTVYPSAAASSGCPFGDYRLGDVVVLKFPTRSWDDCIVLGWRDNPPDCPSGVIGWRDVTGGIAEDERREAWYGD